MSNNDQQVTCPEGKSTCAVGYNVATLSFICYTHGRFVKQPDGSYRFET